MLVKNHSECRDRVEEALYFHINPDKFIAEKPRKGYVPGMRSYRVLSLKSIFLLSKPFFLSLKLERVGWNDSTTSALDLTTTFSKMSSGFKTFIFNFIFGVILMIVFNS